MTARASFLTITLMIAGCSEYQEPQFINENIKGIRAIAIEPADSVDISIKADSELKLEIVSCKASNGFWPWSDAKLDVTYRLTNVADTTLYIQAPYYSPGGGGNPSFLLRKGYLLVKPARLVIEEIIPGAFMELTPGAYLENQTWGFYADDFEVGRKYDLTAFYSNSQWGGFTDETDKKRPIWTGRISSDTIEFTY
jgi:hypothetical protein